MVNDGLPATSRRQLIFWLLSFGILALDQITKWIVTGAFFVGESVSVTSFFSLTYVQNTGAGFGILQGMNWLFMVIAAIAIGAIFYYKKQILKSQSTTIFVSLILGGATGNLVDRIFRGFVVDFFDFHFWPAFNIADTALVIGVIGLLLFSKKSK